MVILKTAGRNVSIWKKGVSEEEAKREMLALYNFLFQGESNRRAYRCRSKGLF